MAPAIIMAILVVLAIGVGVSTQYLPDSDEHDTEQAQHEKINQQVNKDS